MVEIFFNSSIVFQAVIIAAFVSPVAKVSFATPHGNSDIFFFHPCWSYIFLTYSSLVFEKVNIFVNLDFVKEIKFYKTRSGRIPVRDFLDSLSSKHVRKVVWVLELIEKLEQVPIQYFKKLKNTDGIWEVRARFGSNSYRIFGFIDNEEFVVLTNGFSKKSQQTSKQEIVVAEQGKADYLSQKRGK